ncbi:serum amyloid A-2 protein-like [Limulus polyphemus]|uniref:Serum amyloid A-2 protein-like n=1 Tax=Limulus polyphemus TaxID=6850 RepID=A0ABM1T5A4_LIMPO|nr:serum amyloid A-2 protein-like [Limulus polyphemus]XP_022251060.1 serum amyloid A-2 protein-like [Limulus polyphemus]
MRFASMPFVFSLSVVLVLCLTTNVGECGTNWRVFGSCIIKKMGFRAILNSDVRCAAIQMFKSFYKMTTKKCINCDKYFHCQGNYNAVYNCGKKRQSIRTAEVISDCREFSQGGTDSEADQSANRYGRGGGNCARKYLCNVNCKYNPKDGTCSSSNC